MFEEAMRGIVKALVFGGWKVIVGVTGHDHQPQVDAMQRAIEAETRGTSATGFAMMEGELHMRSDDLPYTMDHAGAWETSCMMYVHPGRVDLGQLRGSSLESEEHWQMEGPEGIGGPNPVLYSSPELGRKITERMAALIGAKARALLEESMGKAGA